MKYLVIPGYVRSQRDGDEHFVSASELMRLYGVDPKECRQVDRGIMAEVDDLDRYYPDLVQLRPRYDGRYRETVEEIEAKFKTSPKIKSVPNPIIG